MTTTPANALARFRIRCRETRKLPPHLGQQLEKVSQAFPHSLPIDQVRSPFHRREIVDGVWDAFKYTNYQNRLARTALVQMALGRDPGISFSTLMVLRDIYSLSTLGPHLSNAQLYRYLNSDQKPVWEMALHAVSLSPGTSERPVNLASRTAQFVYSNEFGRLADPGTKRPLFAQAANMILVMHQGKYSPPHNWFEQTAQTTQELLLEIVGKLSLAYPTTSKKRRREIEAKWTSAGIVPGETLYPQIFETIKSTNGVIANQIPPARWEADPRNNHGPWYNSAYHFPKRRFLFSIQRYGLDISHVPQGAECPDAVCFNDFFNSGVGHIRLGVAGFYRREYLLRVPLDSPGLEAGYRGNDHVGQLGDLTADFILRKGQRIPPERIRIVDPFNSTHTLPLAEVTFPKA